MRRAIKVTMTRTTEWTALAAHDPRELVDDGLFTKLSAYVAKDQGVTRAYAEGVVGQALVWLRAVAENPGVRLAMSETVDPGWHAFLLHSQDYRAGARSTSATTCTTSRPRPASPRTRTRSPGRCPR